MKKKGIVLLSTVLLSVLLASAVVYAEEDFPEDSGDQNKNKIENVKNQDNEGDREEKPEDDVQVPEKKMTDVTAQGGRQELSGAQDTNVNAADLTGGSVKRAYGWYFDETDQKWYFYNHQGDRSYGWLKWGKKWYFFNKDDIQYPYAMATDCKVQVGGLTYFFDAEGVMQTGWVFRRGEGWYYTDNNGAMLTGWQKVAGKWYYLDSENAANPGLMAADCRLDIKGTTYFFNGSGVMQTGWVFRRGEGWYYANQNGAQIMGWLKEGRTWYYLDPSDVNHPGIMLAACEKNIGGATYGFNSSGAMWAGWIRKADGWRYYDEYSGQIISGWKLVGGKWYYMNPANDNIMISGGWAQIGNLWYCFNSNGAMATGWFKSNGRWYYLGSDGGARTGWKVVDSDWYYFYTANDSHGGPEGAMACNVKIDGWQLTSSGAMVSTAEMKMNAKAQIYSSSTRYLILVDRNACKVAIYTGWSGSWSRLKYWSCSPGKPSTPTVAGTFKVGSKGRYFDSGSARCHWYTQFRGNYLFHSVLYTKSGRISDGRLGMKLSHGCVRLDINNAKWIYDNIPKGTTVVVY